MTTPITFTTEIKDNGALSLLDRLTAAVRRLNDAQNAPVRSATAALANADAVVEALAKQVQAAKELLQLTKEEADVQARLAAAAVRAARDNITDTTTRVKKDTAEAKDALAQAKRDAASVLAVKKQEAQDAVAITKSEAAANIEASKLTVAQARKDEAERVAIAQKAAADRVAAAIAAQAAIRKEGAAQLATARAGTGRVAIAASPEVAAATANGAEQVAQAERLAAVQNESAALRVREAQAALALAEQRLAAEQEELRIARAITAEIVRGAEAGVAAARSQLAQQLRTLNETQINNRLTRAAGPVSSETAALMQADVLQQQQNIALSRELVAQKQQELVVAREVEAETAKVSQANVREAQTARDATAATVEGATQGAAAIRAQGVAAVRATEQRAAAELEAATQQATVRAQAAVATVTAEVTARNEAAAQNVVNERAAAEASVALARSESEARVAATAGASAAFIQQEAERVALAEKGAQERIAIAEGEAAAVIAIGQQRLAETKAQGLQDILAARANAREKRDLAIATGESNAALIKEKAELLSDASAQLKDAVATRENAASKLENAEAARVASAAESAALAGAVTGGIGSSITGLLELFAAFKAAELFSGFIREGTKFNQVVETVTLSIASLITAEATLTDSQGRVLEGTEALAGGMRLATDQVNKLRIAGLATAATTEQLIDAFQQSVGPGLAAGLSLDETRKVSIQIVQAATAVGVPLNQLNQEVRSILAATIDRNSRVAKVLGITNEEVRLAKEQGNLALTLNKHLEAFTVAGEKAALTMKVIKSNLVEALQVFAGNAVEPMFERLRESGQRALLGIFDLNTAKVAPQFAGLLAALREGAAGFGDLFSSAIDATVSGVKSLSKFLGDNHAEVVLISKEFFSIARSVFSIIGDIAGVVVSVGAWLVRTGALRTILDVVEGIVKAIHFVLGGAINVTSQIGSNISAIVSDLETAIERSKTWKEKLDAIANSDFVTLLLLGVKKIGQAITETQALQLQRAKDANDKNADETATLVKLAREYRNLDLQIKAGKLSTDLVNEARKEQADIIRRMHDAGLDDAAVTKIQNAELVNQAQAIRDVVAERVRDLEAQRNAAGLALNDAVDSRNLFINTAPVADEKTRQEILHDPLAPIAQSKASAVVRDKLNAFNRQVEDAQKRVDTFTDAIKKLDDAVNVPLELPNVKSKVDTQDQKSREKELADARRIEDAAIEQARAQFEKDDADLQDRFKRHQISINEYFTQLKELQATQFQAEIAAAETFQRVAARVGTKGEQDEAAARIAKFIADKSKAESDDRKNQFIEDEKQNKRLSDIDVQFLEAKGEKRQAEIEKFKEQFRDELQSLNAEINDKTNSPDKIAGAQERKFKIDFIINTKEIQLRMDEVRQIIQENESQLQDELNDINQKADDGAITVVQSRDLIVQAYENLRLKLVAVREEAVFARDALGDSSEQPVIDLLDNKIAGVVRQEGKAVEATHKLREAIGQAIISDFTDFLTDGIDKATSFADAMRGLALSVVDSIRKIIAQMIAYQAIAAVFKAFNIPLPKSASPFRQGGFVEPQHFRTGGLVLTPDLSLVQAAIRDQQRMAPSTRKFATGGFHGAVTGPSQPVDSIPIWVTGGEYVFRPEVVRAYGREWFDSINFGRNVTPLPRRRYAEGGAVVAPAASASARMEGLLRAEIGLSDDLIWRQLDTPRGHKAVTNVIRKNSKSIRGVLGV